MGDLAAIVSLTFDDALDVHLDVAMPILERHGLRGTFYVNVGSKSFAARHRDWRAAAARGHELGNHTIFHPGVSAKSWVTEGIALEGYSLDRMRTELVVANQILSMIDGREDRSFAFPCSNPFLGRSGVPRRALTRLGLERTRVMGWIDRLGLDVGSRLVDYTPLVREIFPASRCGGIQRNQEPAGPGDCHKVPAISGDGLGVEELHSCLENIEASRAWRVFVFHGIGGGHALSVDGDAFASFIAKLGQNDSVRVMPFVEAAAHSKGQFGT